MDKKDLRQFIRMQKGQFSTAQLEAFSLPIVKRLLTHPRIKQAQVILMYYSLDDEVNTHEVINELVAQGKTVLLPAVVVSSISWSQWERCSHSMIILMWPSYRVWPSIHVITGWDAARVTTTVSCRRFPLFIR